MCIKPNLPLGAFFLILKIGNDIHIEKYINNKRINELSQYVYTHVTTVLFLVNK